MLPLFHSKLAQKPMSQRFRGFLPVVIDVEMGGVNPTVNALLELAAVFVEFDQHHQLVIGETLHFHVNPAAGTRIDKASLEFNKIDPYNPLRFAVDEHEALVELTQKVKTKNAEHDCQRALVVGHNAWFDLHAIKAAATRCKLNLPFHSFSSIDTSSLGALLNGQTVLARICQEWDIDLDSEQAHSALYDAQVTAELFCAMVNTYHRAIQP